MIARALLLCALVLGPCLAGAEPVRAPDAAQAIARAVSAELPAGLGIAEIVPPASMKSIDGEVTLDWRAAPKAGRVPVLVKVRGERGRTVAQGWAWVELRALRSVLVAKRALRAGDTVAPGDLATEPRPVAAGESLDVEPAVLAGHRVERDLDAGAVIRSGDVVRPPPVAAGSLVRIEVRRGLVRVSAQGVLERPTPIGGLAVARIPEAHRLVHGRLVAPDLLVNDGSEP